MRHRLYDADLTDFARQQETWWSASAGRHQRYVSARLNGDLSVDCAVIGGGYAGLSAAHRLAARHGARVAVLEAGGAIGWGASGLNGGFVAAGGTMLDSAQLVRRAGIAETQRFHRSQSEAVTELSEVIAKNGIACDVTGDGNLCVAHSARAAAALREEVEQARATGHDVTFVEAETFRRTIHEGPETFGALRLRHAFGVHPLKLVLGLADAAAAAGVTIATGALVTDWTREGATHVLRTAAGATVRARRVIVATNGYTPNGLVRALDSRVVPAISSIIVTQAYEAADLDQRGFRSETPVYNARHLLFYYRRLPGGRILFGERGDLAGTQEAAEERAQMTLCELKRVLPAFDDARIAYQWRGLVALTARQVLALGLDPDDPSIAFAFGCHGSGIATMGWAGRRCADLVTGTMREDEIPVLVRGLPPRVPGSDVLVRWGLGAAYRWFSLADR